MRPGSTAALTARLVACAVSLAAPGCEAPPPTDGSLLEAMSVFTVAEDADGRPIPAPLGPGGRLPDDVLSVTMLAESEPVTVIAVGATDGDGRVLIDAAAPESSANRALRGLGAATAVLPAAGALVPLPRVLSIWAAPVTGAPRAAVTVRAFVKRAGTPAPPRRQELPLTVAVVGSLVVDETALARALGTVGRIFSAVGIAIPEPSRVSFTAPDMARFDRVVVDPELGSHTAAVGELLRLSAVAPGEGLVVFLVGGVAVAGGPAIAAIAGGIPVPPVRGTPLSGVLASGSILAIDPVRAGQIIAHELGHALGLFHPTEGHPDGRFPGGARIHDQLDDTAECGDALDRAPADGLLSAEECAGHGADNLMFWAAGGGALELTPGQGEILRRSPLVR